MSSVPSIAAMNSGVVTGVGMPLFTPPQTPAHSGGVGGSVSGSASGSANGGNGVTNVIQPTASNATKREAEGDVAEDGAGGKRRRIAPTLVSGGAVDGGGS